MNKKQNQHLHRNIALALIAIIVIAGVVYVYSQTHVETDSLVSIAFNVHYKDGTSETFEPKPTLSVLSLSIYVGGKEISGIDVIGKVKLNTGGRTVSSWSATTAQQMEFYKGGATVPELSSTGYFSESGGSWTDGTTKTVFTTSITASQIEGAIAGYGDGNWNIQVIETVTMTVNSEAGQETLQGTAVGGLAITFSDYNAMSMQVTVQTVPLY